MGLYQAGWARLDKIFTDGIRSEGLLHLDDVSLENKEVQYYLDSRSVLKEMPPVALQSTDPHPKSKTDPPFV